LCALGAGDIDLGGKQMTFTNLSGRVYDNVILKHATMDGVIYSFTNGAGGGMVRYRDLSTNFLTSLNIPLDRVQTAEARQKADAEAKLRYAAAVRALALQQQEQEALDASNALAAANAQAAAAAKAAKNQSKPNPPATGGKEKRK
jgi:hypothetical protein